MEWAVSSSVIDWAKTANFQCSSTSSLISMNKCKNRSSVQICDADPLSFFLSGFIVAGRFLLSEDANWKVFIVLFNWLNVNHLFLQRYFSTRSRSSATTPSNQSWPRHGNNWSKIWKPGTSFKMLGLTIPSCPNWFDSHKAEYSSLERQGKELETEIDLSRISAIVTEQNSQK